MRKDGYISDRIANQRYINQGLFVVKINNIKIGNKLKEEPQTFVTPKGIEHFVKKYSKSNQS